ncbi:hypothetical protein SDC9_142205 [bioreactor metagenome]|uniref:Uncharacterized protein n=1 Tax=bioreactor metagenome TaxID=1076179 RepID=A0A645DZU5_9ZZZZ
MSAGNLKAPELYKEVEVKENGTNINNHRKKQGSWKITAIAGAIILLFYLIVTAL